jgi:hypothetical protein
VNGSHVHQELVERICAATGSSDAGVDIVRDPLDGALWVRMSSRTATDETLKALNAHGVGAHDVNDHRIRVTGWDMRLMQWRSARSWQALTICAPRGTPPQNSSGTSTTAELPPALSLSLGPSCPTSRPRCAAVCPVLTARRTVLTSTRCFELGAAAEEACQQPHRRAHRVRRERPERAHDGAASGGGGVSDRLKFGGMGGTPLGTGGGLRCAWLWAI